MMDMRRETEQEPVSYSAAFSTAASDSAADAIPATATVSVEAAEHALEAQQLLRLLKARAQPFNRRPQRPIVWRGAK